MVGYWATGNCRIASAPAIIRIMASTHANIGRRIKSLPCQIALLRCSICGGIGSGFNLLSRTRFLQAADNDLIARFQTFANQPFIANRLTGNDRARFNLTLLLTISTVASPRGVRLTPCCGIRMASGWTPSSIRARTNIPGKSVCCGLGKTARRVMERCFHQRSHRRIAAYLSGDRFDRSP